MSVEELQKIISPAFTEEALLDIVRKKSGFSDIQVTKIKPQDDYSKKGDSYLSTIFRFTVDAVGKNKSGKQEATSIPVIVKFFPKNLGRRKTYRSADFFENEYIFFDKVWSAYEKFQEEAQIKEKFDHLPLVLSAFCDGTNDYVAMYDLSYEGYRSAERGSGLDYEHSVAILQILAKFHALGLTFKEKQPEKYEEIATSLKETYFSERLRPWYSNFQKNVFKVNRDAVEKELPVEYLHRLDKILAGDLYGRLVQDCVVRGPLSVVTHGDVWVPNFLIKYEGSTPGKIVMIDFQLARYTTIVNDLVFFLFSCIHPDLMENKWDELVAEYHKALCENLQKYGAKNLITLEAIQADMKKHSIMGIAISMEALIMAQLEDHEVSDLDGIKGDEAVPLESVWIIHPFKEQERRKRIATMLKAAMDKDLI